MHNQDHEKIYWLRQQFEPPESGKFNDDEKKLILARLTRATGYVVCYINLLFCCINKIILVSKHFFKENINRKNVLAWKDVS